MKHNLRLFRSILNIRAIAGMIAFLSRTVLLVVLSFAHDIFVPHAPVFIGNIVGSKILSDSLGLSSVVILLSLLFWSMIWVGI